MSKNMKIIISQSLINLAQSKTFDKITVKDIVDDCNISRQTFYYHFKDIMDVIEWSFIQEYNRVLIEISILDTNKEKLKVFIRFALSNNDAINKLMSSSKKEELEKLIIQTIKSFLIELIKQNNESVLIDIVDIDTKITFATYDVAGVLFEKHNKDFNIDNLNNKIVNLLKSVLNIR